MNAVIAMTGQQMAEQQSTLVQWADARIADAQHELVELQDTFDAMNTARMPVIRITRLQAKSRRRLTFYEKVKAALQAGYQIIPPFDLQLFAIRTDRAPNENRSESRWDSTQSARILPKGEGQYVDPETTRYRVDTIKEKTRDGSEREVSIYGNSTEWRDAELPVRALKPQIIEAVGIALEAKLFDALGIAPAYRASDPIIAGRILHPDGNHQVTFMVAWWIDRSDL